MAVTGVSGEPGLFYFGAAAGGVWKTINSGANWTPIFDKEPNLSIGAVAVAPSNHQMSLCGFGRRRAARRHHLGRRSLQVGRRRQDLEQCRPEGHPPDRRRDRRSDQSRHRPGGGHRPRLRAERRARSVPHHSTAARAGARSSTRTRTPGRSTSPSIRPTRPSSTRRCGRFAASHGTSPAAARAAVSIAPTDGGATWTQLQGHGLPGGILGRIDVAVSAADPHRVYAMIEAKDAGLYRSDDAGQSWRLINNDGRVRQRAWYFSKIYADPKVGRHRLCGQHRPAEIHRRRQDVRPGVGHPRRPPRPVDRSGRSPTA